MTKLGVWKMTGAVFLLCAAMGITVQAQTFTTLLEFQGPDGINPPGALIQAGDRHLYGVTSLGGASNAEEGTVFKINSEGQLTTLYSFCSQNGCVDGSLPAAGLTLATDGSFYGTTEQGGANNRGTVFKITSAGTVTTLYSFCSGANNCKDGANPSTGLVQSTTGTFYGTTVRGGISNTCHEGCGTVFRITSGGALITLHSFDSTEGTYPDGALVEWTDGNFYGMTFTGGGSNNCPGGCGTVFKVSPSGKLTTLHSFERTDGYEPVGPLVSASDGNFYGVTQLGGAYGSGTVFRLQPTGSLTTVYSFCAKANCPDGKYPYGALVQATDGNLYGTTSEGGDDPSCRMLDGCGTIFNLTLTGALTTLHVFGMVDGANPEAGLLQATDGNFYGTAFWGGNLNCGALGCGTVFSLDIGLGPFVTFVRNSGRVGQTGGILGQGFTGTTSVALNGTPAQFTVVSDTFIRATVPPGATTGFVTVATPSGTLTSNVPFRVLQ
jgi:uncharacterized repeat protein (TIGR03803 family)